MASKPCEPGCLCGRHRQRVLPGRSCPPGCTCGKHRSPSETTLTKRRASLKAAWTEDKKREQSRRSTEMWTLEKRKAHSEKGFASWAAPSRRDSVAGSYEDSAGYRLLTGQYDHALSYENGVVSEHRKILYDSIGEGPHLCHWGCGKLLAWAGRDGIFVDHIDGDPSNNDLENLVPSCHQCNVRRAHAGNPMDWSA